MAVTRTFLQGAGDTSDLTEYTFSGQNLGTEAADRHIVVCVLSRGTVGSAVSSVTVAGVSASLVIARTNSTSGNNVAEQWIAAVPTGTTGDVVVTFNGGMLRCRHMLYHLVGLDPTAHDTGSGVAAEDPSTAIDVPADGAAIGCAVATGGSGSETWSGLTEDQAVTTDSQIRATCASDEFASTQTGLAVSVNFTSVVNAALVVASWGPSGDGKDMAWPELNQPLSRPLQAAVPYH
jgi:hypothetical protein